VSQQISERRQQITIVWQSRPVLGKVLILIRWTIIIPVLLVVTLPILLTLAFIVLPLFPIYRWVSMLITDEFNAGDMKVPTFYSPELNEREELAIFFLLSFTGVVFGGIHCAGWFFIFPSNDEAILWRVCSAVLTSVAFLLPPLALSIGVTLGGFQWLVAVVAMLGFIVYILSRLLLLVEAFVSLRNLTPGMLTLVKWTSFIPHI
jgi:hypothetical protein